MPAASRPNPSTRGFPARLPPGDRWPRRSRSAPLTRTRAADPEAGALHIFDLGILDDANAVLDQKIAEDRGQFRIVLGQDRHPLENGHVRAQSAMGLSHLQSDRAAADDQEMARQTLAIENRLIGFEGNPIEPGNVRNCRRRSGGNDETPGGDAEFARFDFRRTDEFGRRANDGGTQALETHLGIVGCYRRDHAADVFVNPRPVDPNGTALDAELLGLARRGRRMRRGEKGFRWNAAVVEAIAAHLCFFDEDGGGAHLGRRRGNAQASRACADDADIDRNLPH